MSSAIEDDLFFEDEKLDPDGKISVVCKLYRNNKLYIGRIHRNRTMSRRNDEGMRGTIGTRAKGNKRTPKKTRMAILSQNRNEIPSSSEESRESRISICSGGGSTTNGGDDDAKEEVSSKSIEEIADHTTTTTNTAQNESRRQIAIPRLTTNTEGNSGENRKGSGKVNTGRDGVPK